MLSKNVFPPLYDFFTMQGARKKIPWRRVFFPDDADEGGFPDTPYKCVGIVDEGHLCLQSFDMIYFLGVFILSYVKARFHCVIFVQENVS